MRAPGTTVAVLQLHHRELEDVGRGALDRRVLRDALGLGAEAAVRRVEVRQEATPSEQRAHGLAAARLLERLVHELADAVVALEVVRDELAGLPRARCRAAARARFSPMP